MKLKDMQKEELEILSYADLTELILKENKKPMNTSSIFKKICDLLGLSEEEYSEKIGDYYTSLTTDKRFLLLDSVEWDLREKHKVEIVLDEDDEEDFEEEEFDEEEFDEEELEENNEENDNSIEITDDEIDLDDSSDLEDLSIVSDDEIEDDMN